MAPHTGKRTAALATCGSPLLCAGLLLLLLLLLENGAPVGAQAISGPSFKESWRYAGETSMQESAAGGAVDSDGDLVLCGKSNGLAFSIARESSSTLTVSADFSAVKLQGATGNVLWTWEDSSEGGADWMVSAGTDGSNDVILGGFTNGGWVSGSPNVDGNRDIAAVKLSGSDGTELWRYQAVSSTSSSGGTGISYVLGVAVDGGGDPVLVGSTYNSLVSGVGAAGDWDFFAIKLEGSTGRELWRIQGGAPFMREGLRGAKMDSSGDLVAAGYRADEESNGDINFLVVKLSGIDGSTLWTFSPNTTSGDVFHGVDLDDRGNVFVAGGEGAPNIEGKFATTPVISKINGFTGEEMWSYRGADGDRIIFNSVTVDQNTGWVVGAGATRGEWVAGKSAGGFDFAAVVIDGLSGDELSRWQDGTVGDDVIEFAQFETDGALYFGGFSSAAWVGGAGDEDMIAIKFEPLTLAAQSTESPTAGPTGAPTPAPSPSSTPSPTPPRTPSPSPSPTPAPSTASRGAPLPSPAPTVSATASSTPALAVVEGGRDATSTAVLERWAVGAIAAAGGVVLVLLALGLWSLRRRAQAKMAAIAAANEKAQRVLPIPSTKPQHMAFADLYGTEDEEAKFSSENVARGGDLP